MERGKRRWDRKLSRFYYHDVRTNPIRSNCSAGEVGILE